MRWAAVGRADAAAVFGPGVRLGAGHVVSQRRRARLLRAVVDPDAPSDGHPFDLAVVRDLGDVDLSAPVTVLSGDNGSGKSTLVEAIAVAAGFNPEGGSRNLRFATEHTHSDLHRHLSLRWRGQHEWGWFLRAESFYAMATHVQRDGDLRGGFGDLHGVSHGESFLDLALGRFMRQGLYVLDEPEAALSIHGQMVLARLIAESVEMGGQFLIATHSPFLLAYPGATVYELDDQGITRVAFDELAATSLWRRFLDDPEHFYRQILDS